MSDSLMGGEGEGAPAEGAPAEGALAEGAPAEGGAPSAPEWLAGIEGVDPDVIGDTSLKAIQDVPSLIKSYVHAQRKMGVDKVVLPNKNSTPEEWMDLYQKLGLPTDFEEYKVEVPEKSPLDGDFLDSLKKVAYENKLLPNQVQALHDFISNRTGEQLEKMNSDSATAIEEGINHLKEEWGEAFDKNVYKAKIAVNEFGGEELKKYLNESGLGNDPQLIKAFSKIGDSFFKEDKFPGEGKSSYAMSPDEASKKANEIMGDFDGPYYNTAHPDHKRIVGEVNKLFQSMARTGHS